MKKYSLIAICLFALNAGNAQVLKTTGGCNSGGRINGIYDGADSTSILINDRSYTVSVILYGSDADCFGDICLNIGTDTLGRLSDVDAGVFSIPINIHLPPSFYYMTYTFNETYINHGFLGSKYIEVISTTGIKQLNEDNVIKIYPMPANDVVYVDVTGLTERTKQLRILDVSGKKIRSIDPNAGNSIIPISVTDVPAGIYLLQIETQDHNIMTRKLVVAH